MCQTFSLPGFDCLFAYSIWHGSPGCNNHLSGRNPAASEDEIYKNGYAESLDLAGYLRVGSWVLRARM